MSVYIDVWHRTHPLTPEDHHRFLDYYGEFVVAPPSDFFEVVAGFRYGEGGGEVYVVWVAASSVSFAVLSMALSSIAEVLEASSLSRST